MINKNLFLRALLLCMSVIGLLAIMPAYGQTTFIRHYSIKDGMPSNNCYYMLQDSHGFLWIATDAGVSRFDGRRFENFTIDDGLPDNQVLQIYEDKKKRIWFVAFNGELSYFFDGKIYNSVNDQTLRLLKFNAVVVSVYHDSADRLWFGTNKNMLFMFDGKVLTKFSSRDKSSQFFFTYINEDKAGKIWTYSQNSVRSFSDGKFILSGLTPVTPISNKALVSQQGNSITYIDKDGLYNKKGTTVKLITKINGLPLNSDIGVFYAQGKDIWVSHKKGVYHQNPQGRTVTYIPDIPTVQVIKDVMGNMWFTTNNGIYMLPRDDNQMFIIDTRDGLSSNVVKSLTKDYKNRLWMGMNDSVLNVLDKSTLSISQVAINNNKFSTGIKKLKIDTANHSLYFSSDYGLGMIKNIYTSRSPIEYLRETTNQLFVIKDFSINKQGTMALALSSGVLLIPNQKDSLQFKISNLQSGHDFFPDRSYTVFYDEANNLWFSNINGINKISPEGKSIAAVKKPRLSQRVNDIKQLKDGSIIMATDGYGLIFLNKGLLRYHFTQAHGLASNICKKIFVIDNHVWVITNKGVNRICLEGKKPVVEAFEYTNSLLRNDVNDLYVDSKNAYFATNSGLVYFSYVSNHHQASAPKSQVTSITVDEAKINVNQPQIILNPSNNKIAFNFSAIDFQEQDIWFRYRLKPTNQWTETRNRRIEASALSPGKYTFELSAKNNTSDWGRPAIIKFQVEERFWQTTWFLVLLFIIAIITFYRIAVVVTQRKKDKEQQALRLKNQTLVLEQRALQAMMNPHFVFNVMNSIQHYINTKDTSSANKVLTGFARLIRKNLEICTKSYISLEEEIEYLSLYLSLEKKRFGDKLQYEIHVDEEIDKEETEIPSMLLQPYIENAIWHGIMPLVQSGTLKISIALKEEQTLLIQITDNGIGIENSLRNKKFSHTSKGMNLTQERVNLINQIEVNSIHINVQQTGITGTTVEISIKLK